MPDINGQTFPEYSYQAYPRYVEREDGKCKIVESIREENDFLGIETVYESVPNDAIETEVIIDPVSAKNLSTKKKRKD